MNDATSKPLPLLTLLALFLLGGCAGIQTDAQWPQNIPARSFFQQAYLEDVANQALQTESEYLTWVVQFYNGSLTMPMGWSDLTDIIFVDLDAGQRALMERKRDELGALISAEWAKDNRVRSIDTGMLTLWGSVLQNELTAEERFQAVSLITEDAQRVLEGRLNPRQIIEARYEEKLGVSLNDEWDS